MAKVKRSSGEQKVRKAPVIELPAILPLPEDFEGGRYANHITVGYTQWEFYLDFWRVEADAGKKAVKPVFVERIILSPHNVKGLMDALKQVVDGFERDWSISLPNLRGAKPRSEREG
ncbi:MAG: DUF3467 domain-containing protein [Dehalococcoidia bacterium]